jgi:drug/metabolite transporter (DMT)-like permease
VIATKKLTMTETTFAIVFWMNVIQLPLGLAGSDPLFALKLSYEHIPAVIGMGVAGLLSHYCLTNAFRAGDASVVIPLDFFRLPLIAVVGWLFYSEGLDWPLFAGAALIFAGIFWNLRSEAARSFAPPARAGRPPEKAGPDKA